MKLHAILIGLLLTQTAHAAVTVTRLPAATAFGGAGRKCTVSLHDLEAPDLVEAFVKQTGLAVRYASNYPTREGGPAAVYEVDFADLSPADAVDELARALGLIASADPERPDGFVVSNNRYGPASARAVAADTTPAVELAEVSRRQVLPASPDSGADAIYVSLQLAQASAGGPTERLTSGLRGVTLDEAVDEQDRPLTDLDATQKERTTNGPQQVSTQVSLRLGLLSPRPTKLTLRGTATLARPKTALRVEVDAFDESPMVVPCEGGTLTVGPVVTSGRNHSVSIRLARGEMDKAAFESVRRLMQNDVTPVFRGPQGEALRASVNGTSWSDDSFEFVISISAPPTPPAPRPTPRPATRPATRPAARAPAPPLIRPQTMRWDSVIETDDQPIRFEFKDVRVP